MTRGNSTPLVLLHGALGSKAQFDAILPELQQHFDVYRLNFEGHADAGPTEDPFRIEYFAENVLGFMDEHAIERANIFGYSMGGYVGLTLAKEHPRRVKKIATLGTVLQWSEEIASRECRYLHPGKIKEKVPHFADRLSQRHPEGWEQVVNKTRDMLQALGSDPSLKSGDWKSIDQFIRFHLGDQDTTAGLAATVKMFNKIDHSELCVLPLTGHPIEEVKKELLLASLVDFFRS